MNSLEELVETECLKAIDVIYDSGHSMTKDQINRIYEEVSSIVLLELYESA